MADLGLKTLCPDEAHVAGAAVGVDIVFVHGLRGGRESTWKKEKVLWPQDLLPKDIKQARILTWGYDANVLNFFNPAGQSSIFGHAFQLLSDLANMRRGVTDRPIIFVAHSLGGLVVKDALSQSHSEGIQETVRRPRLAAIKPATIGVIFAGTPHRGADKARWASVATHLSKFVLRDPNEAIIQALKRGSETLERLQSDFARILSDLPVYTFSEDHDFPGNGKIVDKDSSIIGFPHEEFQVIPADHVMMVKFQSAKEVGYQRMKDAMLNLIEDWDLKRKKMTAAATTPKVEELRQSRVQKYSTYSGLVNAENVVQGDQQGGNINMTLGSGPR